MVTEVVVTACPNPVLDPIVCLYLSCTTLTRHHDLRRELYAVPFFPGCERRCSHVLQVRDYIDSTIALTAALSMHSNVVVIAQVQASPGPWRVQEGQQARHD